MGKLPKYSFKKGFSLIELLVVITILIVLLALTLTVLNPFTQLKKFRDAQRKQDFFQIRNALDTYYNDHGCYPLIVPFGEEWSDGNAVLMKKVPSDPGIQCTSGSCYEYFYQTDGGACPQWAILYAKLEITPKANEDCNNGILKIACPPPPFRILKEFNHCLPIGQISCSGLFNASTPGPIILSPTPTPGPTSTPIPTPTPGPTSTPTPSPIPQICPLGTYYACTGAPVCNNLGTDSNNFCIIHGGTYTCYCTNNCDNACPSQTGGN